MSGFDDDDEMFSVFDSGSKKRDISNQERDGEEDSSSWVDVKSNNKKNKVTEKSSFANLEEYTFDYDVDGGKKEKKKKKAAANVKTNNKPLVIFGTQNGEGPENGEQTEKEKEAESAEKPANVEQVLYSTKSCTHEVAVPKGYEIDDDDMIDPPPPIQLARSYPFMLDPFQRVAVSCIERNESVLVAAHTSAGKTVVAEYAIAVALKKGQRVIYTSPIKALSNQKYRELFESFADVGLMTGDTTINSSASCLVMTTEILRSMLYRGSEVMREVSWVIFDEIHYLRDKERGVVWEETIILLPDEVRFVFLSATIPNALEFASWIANIHQQPCHVVYTEYRPVPLQHYIFPAGAEGLHLVVDENGVFREDNFQRALSHLSPSESRSMDKNKSFSKKTQQQQQTTSDCFKIVRMIMEKSYQPVIVFSFSKKECEAYALQVSKLDLNSPAEKLLVDNVFTNALESLNETDRQLPQVQSILPLLKRGIGIHHSGLLPILKEVIEILFQEGLIKALFATETFSIGLNMPARTVVFTKIQKFDGTSVRWITGGEYIQMSGRAGRRGIDERGIVILMIDEKMEPTIAKDMVKGHADVLNSSFWISYTMMLNLMRVEEISPEELVKKSFHQFQHVRGVPELEKRLKLLEEERSKIVVPNAEILLDYSRVRNQIDELREKMRSFINAPENCVPYLQSGRLVKIRDLNVDWGWGVVMNCQKKKTNYKGGLSAPEIYIVDVLLNCNPSTSSSKPTPATNPDEGLMQVVPVVHTLIDGISSLRVYVPKELKAQDGRQSVWKSVKEVMNRFKNKIPLLDPIEDMEITSKEFKDIIKRIEPLENRMIECAKGIDNVEEKHTLLRKRVEIETEITRIKDDIKKGSDLILKDDLKGMRKVLKRLGFISSGEDEVVEVKGKVAAEISAADELVITEIMFAGVFNDLTIPQVAALLSCFVFEESSTNTLVREELEVPLKLLRDTAQTVAKISRECQLKIDEEEYINSFKNTLMEVTYNWASGVSFAEICKLTEVFEGSIIRSMKRLEELLRQLVKASQSIGNTELETKFTEVTAAIKRDIVFSASLYL